MNKIACIALFIAVSVHAQNAPAPRETAPPQGESAKQKQKQTQPPTDGIVERELPSEEIRKILDLGYNFDVRKVNVPAFIRTPVPCAIPLMPIAVPNKDFGIKNSPANSSIDPKIVSVPQVPTCPQTIAPVVVKPLEPSDVKK